MFSLCLFFDGPIRPTTARVGTCGDPSMTPFGDMSFCTPRMQLPLLPCYAMTDDGGTIATASAHCNNLKSALSSHVEIRVAVCVASPVTACELCSDIRTIHKTQALSIKHIVRGALEGIFAQGDLFCCLRLRSRLQTRSHFVHS